MKNNRGTTIPFQTLCNIFSDTLRLDVWDLNFFYSNPEAFKWTLQHLTSPKASLCKGFFPQFFLYVGRLTKRFFRIFGKKNNYQIFSMPVVFLGLTKNQIDSLSPVFQKICDKAVLVDGTQSDDWRKITALAYLSSILFLPLTLRDYFFSNGVRKEGIIYNFANHWLTYGLYFVLRVLINRSICSCIVLANDHNMEPRVVTKAAKDEGKITFYTQHASVTRVFPPLRVKYALLEGEDALSHYEKAGFTDTQVFLIGNPSFDVHYDEINEQKRMRSLGICVNIFDSMESVERVVKKLRDKHPNLPIKFRIHPGQNNRDMWRQFAEESSLTYSDSLKEGIFDFLKGVDVIIAGNSNVHLDAVLVNVFPIYFDFSSGSSALYYTFLENGLCSQADDEDAVCGLVANLEKHLPRIRHKAKIYCDTVGTDCDGCSSELAAKIINEAITPSGINLKEWQPVKRSQIISYRCQS